MWISFVKIPCSLMSYSFISSAPGFFKFACGMHAHINVYALCVLVPWSGHVWECATTQVWDFTTTLDFFSNWLSAVFCYIFRLYPLPLCKGSQNTYIEVVFVYLFVCLFIVVVVASRHLNLESQMFCASILTHWVICQPTRRFLYQCGSLLY